MPTKFSLVVWFILWVVVLVVIPSLLVVFYSAPAVSKAPKCGVEVSDLELTHSTEASVLTNIAITNFRAVQEDSLSLLGVKVRSALPAATAVSCVGMSLSRVLAGFFPSEHGVDIRTGRHEKPENREYPSRPKTGLWEHVTSFRSTEIDFAAADVQLEADSIRAAPGRLFSLRTALYSEISAKGLAVRFNGPGDVKELRAESAHWMFPISLLELRQGSALELGGAESKFETCSINPRTMRVSRLTSPSADTPAERVGPLGLRSRLFQR